MRVEYFIQLWNKIFVHYFVSNNNQKRFLINPVPAGKKTEKKKK